MNMIPNAFSDSYEVLENASLGFGDTNVLSNDIDVDDAKLATFVKTLPIMPLFQMKANGKFIYDADYPNTLYLDGAADGATLITEADYNLLAPETAFILENGFDSLAVGAIVYDEFEYFVTDGQATDSTTVQVKITGTNDAPVAGDDGGYEVQSGADLQIQAGDLLDNDTDVDIYPVPDELILELSSNTSTEGGSVSVVGGVVTYTAPEDFFGIDTFDYVVNDQNGGTDTGTVTVVVTPDNDPPVAEDDSYQIGENDGDTSFTSVLANDDPTDEPGTGELAAFVISDLRSVASPETSDVDTGLPTGTLTDFNVDGTFSYDPGIFFEGLAEGESAYVAFDYRAFDGSDARDPATVVIEILGENDAPQIDSGGDMDVYESGLAAGSGQLPADAVDMVTFDLSDPDGTTPFLVGATSLTTADIIGTYGTLSFSGAQLTYTLTSAAVHAGDSDTITEVFMVRASDGTAVSAAQSVTVTIHDDRNFLEILPNDAAGGDAIADGNVDFKTGASTSDDFTLIAGADGQTLDLKLPDTIDLTATADGSVIGTISHTVTDTTGGVITVTGTVNYLGSTTNDGTVYELVIDPATASDTGTYTFTMKDDLPELTEQLDFSAIGAGGPQENPTVQNITFNGLVNWNGTEALNAADEDPSGDDDINPNNAGGIGIGNGNINAGEVLCIDISNTTNPVSGFSFDLKGVGGGIGTAQVVWEAYDSNGNLVASSSNDAPLTANLKSKDAQTITIEPDVVFDLLYVSLATTGDFAIDANDTARINRIDVITSTSVDDFDLTFGLASNDGDNDRAPATTDPNYVDPTPDPEAFIDFTISVDADFI